MSKEGMNIMEAIEELEKTRNIPRDDLINALRNALTSAYRKNFGPQGRIEVELDDQGIRVYSILDVVEEVSNPKVEISLEEARKLDETAEVGGVVRREITPDTFGRIAAQTARQVITQKIRETERRLTYEMFASRIGELVVGRVQRFEKGDIYLEYGGRELVLPHKEQIPGERYRQGDPVKAVIMEVRNTGKGPEVVVSRASREFLVKLFEQEIPEISEKIVRIRAVAREAGVRSKVAVESLDETIDPVGACVGFKGSRIQAIVNEVQGEKIDIIPYSEDVNEFVSAALSPAMPVRLEYDPDEQRVTVLVPSNQLSLAIGREGQNVRLAAKLANVKIDIVNADEQQQQQE